MASGVCLCSWKKLCVPKGGTVHACSTMQFSPGTLCCPFPSWSLSILWLLFLSIMLEGAIPSLLSTGCSPAITNTSSLGLCPPLKACQALDKPPLHVGSLGKQDRETAYAVLQVLISVPGMVKLFFLLPSSQIPVSSQSRVSLEVVWHFLSLPVFCIKRWKILCYNFDVAYIKNMV